MRCASASASFRSPDSKWVALMWLRRDCFGPYPEFTRSQSGGRRFHRARGFRFGFLRPRKRSSDEKTSLCRFSLTRDVWTSIVDGHRNKGKKIHEICTWKGSRCHPAGLGHLARRTACQPDRETGSPVDRADARVFDKVMPAAQNAGNFHQGRTRSLQGEARSSGGFPGRPPDRRRAMAAAVRLRSNDIDPWRLLRLAGGAKKQQHSCRRHRPSVRTA